MTPVYQGIAVMGDFVLFLALLWGAILALFLQFVPWGKFLARKRTWSTVVLGFGLDLGLMYLVLPFEWWLVVAKIVGLSAGGILIRSFYNEWIEWKQLMAEKTDDGSQTLPLE